MEIVIVIALLLWIGYFLGKHKQKISAFIEELDPKQFMEPIEPKKSSPFKEWKIPSPKGSIDYDAYIRSDDWLKSPVRVASLIDHEYKCGMCTSDYRVAVHHITYENLGSEKIEDLIPLCKRCHDYTHKVAGRNAGYYPPKKCKG